MKNSKTIAIILAVGIGTFMSALDSSVINLVMPIIKNDFQTSLSMLGWIATAYLLVVSSLLLTFGRLSDLYGQKKFYLVGFAVFVAGSVLCGLSPNLVMLIIFRVIQALGAAMLFATGPAIITNAVPPENRGKALSVTAVSVALGLCFGPVVGGFLATHLGWPSIFYINIPIGLFGFVMVYRYVPEQEKKQKTPFDVLGSVLVFFALLLLLLPLSVSGDYPLPAALFISLIAAGLVMITLFILQERKRPNPMLDVSLFRNRVFASSNAAALFAYMSQFILVFLTPFYLQSLRMFTPSVSGLLYLPMPLAAMVIAPVSGSISDRFDSRILSSAGALLMACGLFMLSLLTAASPVWYIVISMATVGLGFGIFQTPNNSAIMGNVPPANRGTASGTLATMRNIGMAMGIAVSGALFSFFNEAAQEAFSSLGQTGTELFQNSFSYALHRTYLAAAIVALLAMTASLVKGRVFTERERVPDRTAGK